MLQFSGKVVTSAHKVPQGDWFNYISSPHLAAEILMYFSLTVILWNNVTWRFIFGWVLSNQVRLENHWVHFYLIKLIDSTVSAL